MKPFTCEKFDFFAGRSSFSLKFLLTALSGFFKWRNNCFQILFPQMTSKFLGLYFEYTLRYLGLIFRDLLRFLGPLFNPRVAGAHQSEV